LRDINEVFPHKICINLDRRPERWKQMVSKFERCGIEGVQRFAAVDGQKVIVPANWADSPGAFGCLRSHLEVISQARELGWPNVLIFEDDAALDPQLQEKFKDYFAQVPSDWDMLHLGANHMAAPLKVAENVVRIQSANSTFTYALNHTVFDAFIELNNKALTAVDLNNRTLQTEHACYCFAPHLAWVEDVDSDVQVRQKYHWYLKESLVLHGNDMDQILSQTAVIIACQNKSENSLQNLRFLERFYHEHLPGIRVVKGEETTRAACFNAGMKLTDRQYLIFSDSDVFVEEWDIRGNLRMCGQYDCTTGFKSMVELTESATQMLRTSKPMLLTPWFDANDYPRSDKQDAFSKFSVFNRGSIELTLNPHRELRIFNSPNDALLLYR
jgi:glycosyl transferase, family 25